MKELLDIVKERFGGDVVETSSFRGDDAVIVKRQRLIEMCRFLRDEHGFNMLADLCAVDYQGRKDRFEVVYHLYSVEKAKRLRIKVGLNENDCRLPSVHEIWRAANWFEREAFDLFGVVFDGHPNLVRLLTFEGFEGHALRKDYRKDKRQGIPKPAQLVEPGKSK